MYSDVGAGAGGGGSAYAVLTINDSTPLLGETPPPPPPSYADDVGCWVGWKREPYVCEVVCHVCFPRQCPYTICSYSLTLPIMKSLTMIDEDASQSFPIFLFCIFHSISFCLGPSFSEIFITFIYPFTETFYSQPLSKCVADSNTSFRFFRKMYEILPVIVIIIVFKLFFKNFQFTKIF